MQKKSTTCVLLVWLIKKHLQILQTKIFIQVIILSYIFLRKTSFLSYKLKYVPRLFSYNYIFYKYLKFKVYYSLTSSTKNLTFKIGKKIDQSLDILL